MAGINSIQLRAATFAKIRQRIARWLKQRAGSIRPITPVELINEIAKQSGLDVLILNGGDKISPEEAVKAIHDLAVRTGLCVSFICPLHDLKKTLQRKVFAAGRN